jgi:hypothetical protein
VNALEQSLSSSADRAGTATNSAPGAPAGSTDAPKLGLATSTAGRAVTKLLKMFGTPPIEFVLWNGERILPEGLKPVARVTIRDASVLWGLLRNPGVRFGDGTSWRRCIAGRRELKSRKPCWD